MSAAAPDRRSSPSLVASSPLACCSRLHVHDAVEQPRDDEHDRRRGAPPPAAPAAPGRKIKARLFYVADDGTQLTSVERDVAYGEGAVEQAREIISAQIAPVVEPLVSAMPPGTTLRAVFITEGGEAYVDLSRARSSRRIRAARSTRCSRSTPSSTR